MMKNKDLHHYETMKNDTAFSGVYPLTLCSNLVVTIDAAYGQTTAEPSRIEGKRRN